MKSILIDYGFLQIFGDSFESPLCYGYKKTMKFIQCVSNI